MTAVFSAVAAVSDRRISVAAASGRRFGARRVPLQELLQLYFAMIGSGTTMFAKLNRRDRTALIAGAIAAALFLVLNFAVFPLLDRFARSPEAVEQKELTLRRYQRLLADTGLAKAQHSSTQERLTELEAGLLESPSASLANAEWQRLIGELADSKGIELGSSEFLRTEDVSQDYALMTGRVQFRCRLDQLVDFLAALASSPKLLCVKRLTVSAPQGDPQNRLNVELMVGAATRKTVASVK